MPQKPRKKTTNSSNQKNRNTSYYKSRVGKQKQNQKKESSAFLDKAKKRQMTNYRLAMSVLLVLMVVFTAFIGLGVWLNSLVGPEDPTEPTEGSSVSDNIPDYSDSGNDSMFTAGTPVTPQQPVEISEIFYTYNGVYLDILKIESLENLQYFIENIKSKNINAVSIDIKKEDGNVPFPLNGQTAAVVTGAEQTSVSIEDIIGKLHENGLYVSGTIACFKDNLAATTFVNDALKGSSLASMRWEDSDGSCWLNPYSEGAREYVQSIVRDSAKLGFDEIVLSWFFFPDSNSVSYGGDEINKFQAVRDFISAQRIALDDVNPKIKLGLSIPIQYFLNTPNETMGLNSSDLIDNKCNFLSTSFAPSNVSGLKVNGEVISNPDNNPNGTVKALCAHFKYISDVINFRPYIQAFNGYGDEQILMQKDALSDSGITMWQIVNYDNNY